jgi:hypothetical protein
VILADENDAIAGLYALLLEVPRDAANLAKHLAEGVLAAIDADDAHTDSVGTRLKGLDDPLAKGQRHERALA